MKLEQVEMVSINDLVSQNHPYRKLKESLKIDNLLTCFDIEVHEKGANGYGKERLTACLILQFMEDNSDREFERFISENNSAKWFCGFSILEKTPDYTTICKFRNSVGLSNIEKLFATVKLQLKEKGYLVETFTFVDSTALISKLNLWEERDKIIKVGYEKLNNENIEKFSVDKEAKIGAKSSKKFWYGYKKHVAVNMSDGFISDVDVTSANVTDADGVLAILPSEGAVVGDKGYIGAIKKIKEKNLHPMIIKRNNMKSKIKELDKYISKLRSPYEGVFSKQNKRVRYQGIEKNKIAEFLFAIAYNFRRLLKIT